MERLSIVLLIAWLALIGADRVDFFGGGGPFLLTPFLVLTPLVLAIVVARALRRRGLPAPVGAAEYAVAAACFLAVILISVFASWDLEIATKRYALLLAQVAATLVVALSLADRDDLDRVLAGGAYAGLTVAFAFDALQVASLLSDAVASAGGDFVDLHPSIYGFIPRLSGPSLDANRGGLLILIYLYFLVARGRPSGWRSAFLALGSVALVLTLSRSVLLALLAIALVAVIRRGIRVSKAVAVATAGLGAAFLLVLMVSPDAQAFVGRVAEAVAPRFSIAEGSSSEHLRVMAEGWEVASRGAKEILLGIGYGNSFLALHEVYGGDAYGNFHSLYLTLLAESGVFALGLGLLLLVRPLLLSNWLQPMAAGLIAFNLFYQSLVEPLFWLVLAMAWMDVGEARRAEAAPAAREDEGEPAGSRPGERVCGGVVTAGRG